MSKQKGCEHVGRVGVTEMERKLLLLGFFLGVFSFLLALVFFSLLPPSWMSSFLGLGEFLDGPVDALAGGWDWASCS